MARFAQYYLQYERDAFSVEWEKREEHLGKLLEKDDSFSFHLEADPQKEHKHKVYHLKCNKNIIVMRFANDKPVDTENDFEPTKAPHEPSCFILFDNRKDIRTVAIQKRKEAFSNPNQVAKVLGHQLNDYLNREYSYILKIHPDFYPEDLYTAWEKLEQHIAAVRFGTPDMEPKEIIEKVELLKTQGKAYFDNSMLEPLLQMAVEAKKAKYRQMYTVMPEEKKAVLYVDKSSTYIKNLITLSAAIGEPVELITNDRASFKCFVDHEDVDNTDKIVSMEFDPAVLEKLFKKKDKDGNKLSDEQIDKLEEKVVELLNGIKHVSEDIEPAIA